MAAETLSPRAANRATLARQMLLARERVTVTAALERLLAMQAQLPRPPYVGLWTRVAGFERGQLDALLAKRTVVRTTFLRGTLHLLTAADYVALRATLQPGLDAGLGAILKERLAALDLGRLETTARGYFEEPLTFEELRERFLAADPKADERAMGYAVRLRVPLVMVPEPDQAWGYSSKARFTLADGWLKRPVPVAGKARLEELVRRTLAGYGPASVADLQSWTGTRGLKEIVDGMRPRLRVFKEGQRELFDLPEAPRPDASTPAPVRFLPEYDSVLPTRSDERFVAKADRKSVYLSALRIAATVLVDGVVAGTWTLDEKKGVAVLGVTALRPWNPATRKQVEAEAEALLAFAHPDAKRREVRLAK